MAEKALDQPVHLNIHPDEPVRSLDAAAKIIHRHTAGRVDEKAQKVLRAIADATSPRGVAAVSGAFRRWAKRRACCSCRPRMILRIDRSQTR
jgi:hypothetical protein